MKKLGTVSAALVLLSGAASAADLPRRADPPAFLPPPAFSWSGVWIGTHTAYTFSDSQRATSRPNDAFGAAIIAAGVVPGTTTNRMSGFANFGGGFGLDHQFTPGSGLVVGAAFDADWTDLHKTRTAVGAPVPFSLLGAPPGLRITNVQGQGLGFLATVNGRLGYAFDRLLVYATGGVAIGKVEYAVSGYLPNGTLVFAGEGGGHEVGYDYGAGIEYAIPADSLLGRFDLLGLLGVKTGGTTLKVEYIRYDLGSRTAIVSDTVGIGTSSTVRGRTEGNMVRAGFTVRFGG